MGEDWVACLEKRPVDRTEQDVDIILKRLKDEESFQRLHPAVLRQLCCYGYYQDLDGGITLFRQGDIGTQFYAVLTGTLKVTNSQNERHQDAVTPCFLGPGEMFGESVLDDTPRQATVITSEFCELIRVNKKDFRLLWEQTKDYLGGYTFASWSVHQVLYEKLLHGVISSTENDENEVNNNDSPQEQGDSKSIAQACAVIRYMLYTKSPELVQDREFDNKTYRHCCVGSELVSWLLTTSRFVHNRLQSIGIWQALLESSEIANVNSNCEDFQDNCSNFYQFTAEEMKKDPLSNLSSDIMKVHFSEDDFRVGVMSLGTVGPDALFRAALKKPSEERTSEDLDIIFEELLHISALSDLSGRVKRELAAAFVFEVHPNKGTMIFSQGEVGGSWYIILKGSVNVLVYGKGVVSQLHAGDDFGKLALANEAPRAATIETNEDNCQLLRIGKGDFNRIMRDVEANTLRLKEHGKDVLVLEKMTSRNTSKENITRGHSCRTIFLQFRNRWSQVPVMTRWRYTVMAGTPEKMIEHLLEIGTDKTRTDDDKFLDNFLFTYPVFMSTERLCSVLLSTYRGTDLYGDARSPPSNENKQQVSEHTEAVKRSVVQMVLRWMELGLHLLFEDLLFCQFLDTLASYLVEDKLVDELAALKMAISQVKESFPHATPNLPLIVLKQSAEMNGSSLRMRRGGCSDIQDLVKKPVFRPLRRWDESIFKVFCADHTYTTVKVKYEDTAQKIVDLAEEKIVLGHNCVLCEVKSTGEIRRLKETEVSVYSGLSINGRLFIAPKEHIDSLTPLPEQAGPKYNSFSALETVTPLEIAYQLTFTDHEMFGAINLYEFVFCVFGNKTPDHLTTNFDVLLARFKKIQYWVATELCLTQHVGKRVNLLKNFIKIASHCKQYQNWNSFYALVMGLSCAAVGRLSQTWEKLPSKYKRIFKEFEADLDPSRNHRVYRLQIGKMTPPIVPFIPLLLKDLTFVHEGNKTYLKELVNFEKMRMIASTLHMIQHCRNEVFTAEQPPSVKNIQEVSNYLRNLQVIDNQRTLMNLSHRLEPKKP